MNEKTKKFIETHIVIHSREENTNSVKIEQDLNQIVYDETIDGEILEENIECNECNEKIEDKDLETIMAHIEKNHSELLKNE